MSMVPWTTEADIQLINLVKKYDMFYNPKSSDYRNTALKSDVWKRIGSILDKSDDDCRQRWIYVRRMYVRRRLKPMPKKFSATIKQGLKRAKLLTFLDQYRNIDASYNDSSTDHSVNEPASSEVSYDNDNAMSDNDIVEVTYENNDIVELNDEDYEESIPDKTDKPTEDTDRKEMLGNVDSFDETDHFFASMAKITKKLPRREQIVLRMQISTMVGNAELKQMDEHK